MSRKYSGRTRFVKPATCDDIAQREEAKKATAVNKLDAALRKAASKLNQQGA
jgi:hypothetical protein